VETEGMQPVSVKWGLSIYRYPIGILTVHTREGSYADSRGTDSRLPSQDAYTVNLSLFPSRWIASIAVQLTLDLRLPQFGAPFMKWTITQAAYNDNADLLRCLRQADISGLKLLLQDGKAQATDLLAPWGNSLLHVG